MRTYEFIGVAWMYVIRVYTIFWKKEVLYIHICIVFVTTYCAC